MFRLFLLSLLFVAACDKAKPLPPEPPKPEEPPPCGLDASETVQPAVHELPALIGGSPADTTKWPASVYSRAGSASCSSTLVGPRVLITAAHCVSNGGTTTFTAGANQYRARCTHHPEYRGNSTADWAFCLVERPVTGVVFERMATKLNLRKGDKVKLTGYGCTKPGGGGGNDGIFRIGEADVQGLPSGKNYDVVTYGGAALCFGDSGGAAYLEYPDGGREAFAINSRGNIKNTSYLSSLASTTAQNFFQELSEKNGVKICGMHEDAEACRPFGAPKPPDPPLPPNPKYDFEVRGKVACVRGKMNPGQESKKDALIEGIKKLLE